jgi:multiple sugar transport system substrate-binding protein
MNRWGFPQGQGRLAGVQLEVLPIPKALTAALDGRLDAGTAVEQAQADLEQIARSIK